MKKLPNPPAVREEEVLSEEELARLEAKPGLQQMVKDAIQAEHEGRVFTHEQVKEMLCRRRHG
jgi:hypothetical protein